ncbi:Hpt domain-containing protein [Ruminococcus sp. 5_1_39BFAA]|uniref:Hpt domain-containing protein n=1 Tax=Ruminococcus sp. 5_1_39BFAA TaxID=457412 RepID=UPI003563BE06
MTIRECYDQMGADYEGVAGRLRTEERIRKFLLRVPDDKSYELLCQSISDRNMEEAFRAAHTMKGICQNLSLSRLGTSSSLLAEMLRNRQEYGEDIEPVLAQVKEDYRQTVECIKKLEG